jgi:zona occludens toxin
MIELITGLPGNGKTLFTLTQIQAQAERENRQVFYHGIPEVQLSGWEILDDPKAWASVPPNSIVVVDEAQKTFRNRSLGSVPPQFVTDLETHRHLGIDLVLITQHPSLIDPAVRRLAGRHQHLVRIWGMEASTVHRWDAVKDNCDKSRADSEKTKWGFNKKMYGMYKSAEVHTMKRSIPGRVKLLMALPVVLALCGWYVYQSISKKVAPPSSIAAPAGAPGQAGSVAPPKAARFDPIDDARTFVDMNTPRITGLPHTAPKYDEITKPVRAPIPAACIQRGTNKCSCFSQQGTPMDVEFNMCIGFARNGWFQDFDADRDRQESDKSRDSQRVLSDRKDIPSFPSPSSSVVAFDSGPPRANIPAPSPVAKTEESDAATAAARRRAVTL